LYALIKDIQLPRGLKLGLGTTKTSEEIDLYNAIQFVEVKMLSGSATWQQGIICTYGTGAYNQ